MTPGKYKLAIELFHQVRTVSKEDRDSALEQACEGDRELREQVRALLESDDSASDDFLQRPAWEDAPDLIPLPESKDLRPGQVIGGRYRIRERIGAGGMGVVYKAEDLRLPRSVALKVVPANTGGEGRERSVRFQREARTSSQLNHPNIVAIYDTGTEAGISFLAMELVEGRTLRSLIGEADRPDAKTVLDTIGQIASALSTAHGAGIIHRDIKPENVIVRSDGIVKVLDFGLACMRDPGSNDAIASMLTRPGQVAGTLRYLSPEQVLGKRVTAQTDVFSLGVVAYEYATGTRPFDGATDGAVFDAILHREVEPPSAIRPELGSVLDAVIMGAIEKDLDVRFQSIAELRSACKRAERMFGAPAKKQWSVPARVRPLGSLTWKLGVAAACVTAAIGLLIYAGRAPGNPAIGRITQITAGETVNAFVNDGTRVYYSAGKTDSNARFFQTSVDGGPAEEIPNMRGMLPLDISSDRTRVLLGEAGEGRRYSIWLAGVVGWKRYRLGDFHAWSAHLSQRGDKVVYTTSNYGRGEVRVANIDGSGNRVIYASADPVLDAIFLDGDRRIRIQLKEKNRDTLWDIDPDGRNPQPYLPDWDNTVNQLSPAVSPDGAYSLFTAGQNPDVDLWAVQEGAGLFGLRKRQPFRLTTGPLWVSRPQFSPDTRRIFYLAESDRTELIRYDPKKKDWQPYLDGINALTLEFSRDGQWITFVAPPGRSTWLSRADGRDAVQLTRPPMAALNPRLSPDNKRVVFWGGVLGQRPGMFVVSANGGPVVSLKDPGKGSSYAQEPTWTPDSQSVLFSVNNSLYVMNVSTGHVIGLPNSEGMLFPRLSPDGKYATGQDDSSRLWLYDMATGDRAILSTLGAGYPIWSRDSKFVYFENDGLSTWYRVNIFSKAVEKIADVSTVRMAPGSLGWVGLTPDGSTISARAVNTRHVYSLTWTLP